MTDDQRRALNRLWFIYGNYGTKHTWGNHKFIQILLERGEDDRQFFRKPARIIEQHDPLTAECEAAVDAILSAKDWVEAQLKAEDEEGEAAALERQIRLTGKGRVKEPGTQGYEWPTETERFLRKHKLDESDHSRRRGLL